MANVTALDNGRFVTAHVRNPADGEVLDKTIVQASVFESTGAAVGSATPVSGEQGILSDWRKLQLMCRDRSRCSPPGEAKPTMGARGLLGTSLPIPAAGFP